MKIKINARTDRDAVVIALANNGYKVFVKRETDIIAGDTFYVIFEEEVKELLD